MPSNFLVHTGIQGDACIHTIRFLLRSRVVVSNQYTNHFIFELQRGCSRLSSVFGHGARWRRIRGWIMDMLWCLPWWSKSVITGLTWQKWEMLTKSAFLTLTSAWLACSPTLSRALASSSRQFRSRLRPSNTSCSNVTILLPPIHHGRPTACLSPCVPSCILQSSSLLRWDYTEASTSSSTQKCSTPCVPGCR